MVRVAVPDAFEGDYIAVAGTPPNADETRLGPPRDEHIRVDEKHPRNLKVREDDDGSYVGTKPAVAERLRAYFAEEFEAEYGDDEPDGESESETYTCAGKDGECTREVDEPGGYCWQHEDSE